MRMQHGSTYSLARAALAAACAVACSFACFFSAGCASEAGSDGLKHVNLPAPIEHVLQKVLPYAEVSPDQLPDTALPQIEADEREVDEAILALQRPVLVNVYDYEDAIAIIADLPESSDSISTFGTFVISEGDMAAIQGVVDGWADAGRSCGFILLDLETGAGLEYNIDKGYYSASSIKGINLCAISYYHPDCWSYFYDTIEGALVNSSNSDYEAVFNAYSDNIPNLWRGRAHLGNQQWGRMYTYYSAREFAQLWCVNWDYLTTESEAADTLRDFMSRTLRSSFASELGGRAGYTVCSKAGWETGENTGCVEGGYVVSPGGAYLLVILTDRYGYPDETLSPLVSALDAAYQAYAPQKARG